MDAPPRSPDQLRLAFGFIVGDITTLIQHADAIDDMKRPERKELLHKAGVTQSSGGNLLCALGLLCYTEFAGTLIPQPNRRKALEGRNAFNAFFGLMGQSYKRFLKKHNESQLYDWIRGGAVHHYFIKKSFGVSMHHQAETDAAQCGIVKGSNGVYLISVPRYLEDFRRAFEVLLAGIG